MTVFRLTHTVALAILTLLWTGCSEQEELRTSPVGSSSAKPVAEGSSARFSEEAEVTDIDAVYALGQYAQALNEDFSFDGGEHTPVKTTVSDEERAQMIELLGQIEGVDPALIETLESAKEPITAVRLSGVFVPQLEAELDIYYICPPTWRWPIIIPTCRYRWGCFPSDPWPWWCKYAICFPWFEFEREIPQCTIKGCGKDFIQESLDKLGLSIDPERIENARLIHELSEGPVHLGQ